MSAGNPFLIAKEMGVSHQEFFKFLNRVVPEESYRVENNLITIPGKGKRVEILISEEKIRVISSSIKLPYTNVELSFYNYTDQERSDFMERFKIAFHRGGG